VPGLRAAPPRGGGDLLLLLGSRDLIASARRWRKALGGGLRQAGFLAAAGLYALEHQIARLAEDHANARRLADGLRALGLDVDEAQTNIVFLRIPVTQVPLVAADLRAAGVLATIAERTRLVTHLDVTREQVERVLGLFRKSLSAAQ
jgi:threonine aldolase